MASLIKDILEGAIYLSVKDRRFDPLPSDATDLKEEVAPFVRIFNQVLYSLEKLNPSYEFVNVPTSDVVLDTDLNVSYVPLKEQFSVIYRAAYQHSGGTLAIPLENLGINDFFTRASVRSLSTLPVYYNYNVFSNRLYVYPSPVNVDSFNIFGKKRMPEVTVDQIYDEPQMRFPETFSKSFLLYLEYYLGRFYSTAFNVPWQPQKESVLQSYKRIIDSENQNTYQHKASFSGEGFPFKVLWNSVRGSLT